MGTSICPCGELTHPQTISNPPGEAVVRYRAGDFLSFREALLRPLPGETQLQLWRPGARQDLAVQVIEWWAYLADVLTFYNERVANQHYLRTADLEESVRRIVKLLGYRPRPGIGATGVVAALIKGPKPLIIPAGFKIQSKPGPGQTPQTFETDKAITASLPDAVSADPPPVETFSHSLLLAGEDATVQIGERLLVINRGWAGAGTDFATLVTVSASSKEKDARGKTHTRISFTPSLSPPAGILASNCRLMRSSQSIGLWPYTASGVITASTVHLASLARQIQVGDPLLFDIGGSSTPIVKAASNGEIVWFANPPDTTHPETGPSPTTAVPIPILHSVIGFSGTVDPATISSNIATTRLRFAWLDVGTVIATPAATVSAPAVTLTAAGTSVFPSLAVGQSLLLEDQNGDGSLASASASVVAGATQLPLTGVTTATLKPPLRALFGLLPVSRGKSVLNEVLGSGDATVPGQEFVLKKSPLTYLPSTDPSSPESYRSTLRVWVNNVEWKEVPSFYGQRPDAKVFVTREDDDQKTHVMFGDGVNGALLPSGASNVVASYRYESGAAVPESGKLTVMLDTLPGLRGIVNPVPPAGGADPDPPDRLKTLAPKSVLTFNRAVSGADYEAIAAATPGVARARAYWSFDATRQQTVVKVYVGDTDGAVAAAKTALARTADPNRALSVQLAAPVVMMMGVLFRVAAGFLAGPVLDAVRSALVDPDTGLLGANRVRIGQTLFRSQIFQACLDVEGVEAVHIALFFEKGSISSLFASLTAYRYFAGEGKFYQLNPADLFVVAENPNG